MNQRRRATDTEPRRLEDSFANTWVIPLIPAAPSNRSPRVEAIGSVFRAHWRHSFIVLLIPICQCSMRAPYSVEFIVRGPLDRSVVQRIEMTLGDEDYRLNRRDEPSIDKKLLTDYLKSGSSGTLFGALYHSSSGLDSTMLLDFDLHICCSPGPREPLTPDMKAEVERIAALVHEILVPHVETDRLTITVYEQSGSANPWDSAEAKTRPWRPSN